MGSDEKNTDIFPVVVVVSLRSPRLLSRRRTAQTIHSPSATKEERTMKKETNGENRDFFFVV